MSKSIGATLPDALVRALSQDDLAARAGHVMPLITVDEEGRPHPMLCTYAEVLAVGADLLRVVVGSTSSTARNLAERRMATLLIVEPERVVYVKCRAAGAPLVDGPLARFALAVEDVLEDSALEWEGGARITSGIAYAPALALNAPQIASTLALLRRDAG
jgi:hypothetical protein